MLVMTPDAGDAGVGWRIAGWETVLHGFVKPLLAKPLLE
jgi:hypothetical protein